MYDEKIIIELIKLTEKYARHRELKNYLLSKGFSEEESENYILRAIDFHKQKKIEALPLKNKIFFSISFCFAFVSFVLLVFVFPYTTFVNVRLFSIFGSIIFVISFFLAFAYYKSWEKEKIHQDINFSNDFNTEIPIGLLFVPVVIMYFIFSWILKNGQEKVLLENQIETVGTIVSGTSLSSRSFDITELIIEYKTKEGKKVTVRKDVNREEFGSFNKGQKVIVIYSSKDLNNIELLSNRDKLMKFKKSEERNLNLGDLLNFLENSDENILENLNKIKYGWVYEGNRLINEFQNEMILKELNKISYFSTHNIYYDFKEDISFKNFKETSNENDNNLVTQKSVRSFENDTYHISISRIFENDNDHNVITIMKK